MRPKRGTVKTEFGTIDQTSAAHKYGGDTMAEYLDMLAGTGMHADRDSGDMEAPTGWFAQFGKRLLRHDDRGFVWVERFDTKEQADLFYDALDAEYAEWADDDDGDFEISITDGKATVTTRCTCPGDCNCRHPWRPNYCGCTLH